MLLDVKGLSAGYGDAAVLRGIDIALPEGGIAAVIGSNGAGKTTLMRVLAGSLAPAAGRVELAGRDITAAAAHQRVALGMALVPEGRLVFPDLTVDETLRVGAYVARARPGWRDRAEAMYALFPRLRERRRTRAGALSGGEQQMLALARGLMSRPSLLLLDEPSLGLAPGMAAQMFDLVRRIRQDGVAVLLVEQDVETTLEVADLAYVLENGTIVARGPAAALRDSDLVRESYLGL